MALKGIRVLELAGLAPAPFCGMILSDFGANVIRIDKPGGLDLDRLSRGKRSLAIDLKTSRGIGVVQKLSEQADVLIEPFRKGVMEKMKLGPERLLVNNPRLIYARLTGYGQSGCYSNMAGHGINYSSIAGVLSMLGRKGNNPFPPLNLLDDFAGGGLICALGITLALFERTKSGKGQVIDANMVEGTAYVSSWLWATKNMFWNSPRGENLLDSGSHFYDTYKTKDGKFMAVGAIEPQFYEKLLEGLGTNDSEIPQMDWTNRKKVTDIFLQKTQEEWCRIFDGTDACVTPVLSLDGAADHPHNRERGSFLDDGKGNKVPRPSPLLERTPAAVNMDTPGFGQHSVEVLQEAGFGKEEIDCLLKENVVIQSQKSKL